MILRDLMTDEDRAREDHWAEGKKSAWEPAKWDSMVRYVRKLSRADQTKWASTQTEAIKQAMRDALRKPP